MIENISFNIYQAINWSIIYLYSSIYHIIFSAIYYLII